MRRANIALFQREKKFGMANPKGGWRNGHRHGQGRQVHSGGSVYEGEWEDGDYHGLGTYTHRNGNVYRGRFEHGRIVQ